MNTPPQLLAVVEVDEDERVRCQAGTCNHSVYRRIHVVRVDGEHKVLGSSCFKETFAGQPVATESPKFTAKSGRRLTVDERAQLIGNTEHLLARLQCQFVLGQIEAAELSQPGKARRNKIRVQARLTDPFSQVAPEMVAEAKQRVRTKHGVDPELPGWRGHLLAALKAVLREYAA